METLHTSLQPSSLIFAATTALAAYLSYRAFAPPATASISSKPTGPSCPNDSLKQYNLILFLRSYRFYVALSGILHTTFTIFKPLHPSAVCPNPNSLNPSLFTWNLYTISVLCCMIGGGCIRVIAYAQLGNNFTFELATPSGLMTRGLYKYVQHPGYTGGLICTLGVLLIFGRFDGGIGCFVPTGWVPFVTAVHFVMLSSVMIVIFRVRVAEEEDMLEKTFGEDWREYHRRTKRFLPGVV